MSAASKERRKHRREVERRAAALGVETNAWMSVKSIEQRIAEATHKSTRPTPPPPTRD